MHYNMKLKRNKMVKLVTVLTSPNKTLSGSFEFIVVDTYLN